MLWHPHHSLTVWGGMISQGWDARGGAAPGGGRLGGWAGGAGAGWGRGRGGERGWGEEGGGEGGRGRRCSAALTPVRKALSSTCRGGGPPERRAGSQPVASRDRGEESKSTSRTRGAAARVENEGRSCACQGRGEEWHPHTNAYTRNQAHTSRCNRGKAFTSLRDTWRRSSARYEGRFDA